jgi:hypothetical protein
MALNASRITSRKYYNFMNDAQRKGDTVKPFNETQSWDLLMKLLGPEWQDLDRKGLIKVSEEAAAKELLKSLGGVSRLQPAKNTANSTSSLWRFNRLHNSLKTRLLEVLPLPQPTNRSRNTRKAFHRGWQEIVQTPSTH